MLVISRYVEQCNCNFQQQEKKYTSACKAEKNWKMFRNVFISCHINLADKPFLIVYCKAVYDKKQEPEICFWCSFLAFAALNAFC